MKEDWYSLTSYEQLLSIIQHNSSGSNGACGLNFRLFWFNGTSPLSNRGSPIFTLLNRTPLHHMMLAHLKCAHCLVQCEIFHEDKLSRFHILYNDGIMSVCDETESSHVPFAAAVKICVTSWKLNPAPGKSTSSMTMSIGIPP